MVHFVFLYRISKAEVQPFLEEMLSNLFNLLTVPGSQENEYVMKGTLLNLRNVCSFIVQTKCLLPIQLLVSCWTKQEINKTFAASQANCSPL